MIICADNHNYEAIGSLAYCPDILQLRSDITLLKSEYVKNLMTLIIRHLFVSQWVFWLEPCKLIVNEAYRSVPNRHDEV